MEGGGALLMSNNSINGYPQIVIINAFSTIQTRLSLYPLTMPKATNSVSASAKPHNRSASNKGSSLKTARKPHLLSASAPREAALTDIQTSSDLGSALARSGVILKASEFNLILRNFGRSRRWKEISQLFEWMQNHEKTNVASYSSYIKFMAESRNTSRALSTYEHIHGAMRNNVSICNAILSCLVKNNNFDKAINLFKQMKQCGLQPDVVTYSTLLAGCIKAGNGYRKALVLVKELEASGILMDSVMYGTLIAVCASNCQCEEAEMYFIRMKDEGHSPNLYHYSSLLNAYSVSGNYQKADELFQGMKAAGLVPNEVVLTTLLKVYVRGGFFEKSRLLLSELEALGYAGDEMPYCLLMDGLSKYGKIDEAKLVFDEMNKRQVRSDGYSHSIMISAFCRAGLVEEAKKLARDYEAMYNRYDLVILNVMLCAYCGAGDMECVMQILSKMDKLGINPDQITFRTLVKYFCKEKLYLLAYRTMQDMHAKGYELEEEILSSLFLHLVRVDAHSEAFSVYNILRSGGAAMCGTFHEKILHILLAEKLLKDAYVVVKENAKLISAQAAKRFLTAFTESGDLSSINDALETIHTSGYKIHQDVFYLAISRYIVQPEKKELLFQLLQWMSSHGYVVDSSARNLILKKSNLYGHQFIADILSKQPSVSST